MLVAETLSGLDDLVQIGCGMLVRLRSEQILAYTNLPWAISVHHCSEHGCGTV